MICPVKNSSSVNTGTGQVYDKEFPQCVGNLVFEFSLMEQVVIIIDLEMKIDNDIIPLQTVNNSHIIQESNPGCLIPCRLLYAWVKEHGEEKKRRVRGHFRELFTEWSTTDMKKSLRWERKPLYWTDHHKESLAKISNPAQYTENLEKKLVGRY